MSEVIELKLEPVNEKQTAGQIEKHEEKMNRNEAPVEVIEAVVQQDDQFINNPKLGATVEPEMVDEDPDEVRDQLSEIYIPAEKNEVMKPSAITGSHHHHHVVKKQRRSSPDGTNTVATEETSLATGVSMSSATTFTMNGLSIVSEDVKSEATSEEDQKYTPPSPSRRHSHPVGRHGHTMAHHPHTGRPTTRRSYQNTYSANKRGMHAASAPRPFQSHSYLSHQKAPRVSSALNGKRKAVDEKTRELMQDIKDLETSRLETEFISSDIFSLGTGISDDEIRRIMRVRVSTKAMDPEHRISAGEKVIKRLKEALAAVTKGKNEYVKRSVQAEKACIDRWASALEIAQMLDEDRAYYKSKVKQVEVDNIIWKDNAKDTMRELSLADDKIQYLRSEIEGLKLNLTDAQNTASNATIQLELQKRSNQEMMRQEKERYDRLKEDGESRKRFKKRDQDAIDHEVKKVTKELKQELREYRDKVEKLDQELAMAQTQFARAETERASMEEQAVMKDVHLAELTKSIGNIQSQSHNREAQLNHQLQCAESKMKELENALAVTKGELNVYNNERSTLKETLNESKQERLAALKSLDEMKGRVDEVKEKLQATMSQLTLEKELRAKSEQKEREERNERIALSAQMLAMTKEHAQMEVSLNESSDIMEAKWHKEVQIQVDKLEEKQKELDAANERILGLLGEVETLKLALKDEKHAAIAENAEEMGKLASEIEILKERLRSEESRSREVGAISERKVQELEQTITDLHTEKRKMHNLIQELRGNVRVFARVRPFLPDDGVDDNEDPMCVPRSETALKLYDKTHHKGHNFEFDKVFGPSVGQDVIFKEVSELVQSALDGYSVCLFAYGQSGSGKTHTMQGIGHSEMRGIIPRAIEQVGQYKETLEHDGWSYSMQVSFVEIYNEVIRDLLREEDDPSLDLKHEIKVNPDGRRYITNVHMIPLDPQDIEAVEDVMRLAHRHRTTGSTDMNSVSSRSHSVFTLHLTAVNKKNKQALRGTLNLVDLAGSERLSRSHATGTRQKETLHINKSLSALSSVFVAIGKKASHIPFRDSKLTYLLQPSLSGDGKCLMFVNLSPTEGSAQETLCSLRFAAHVNTCELGKAKRSLEEMNEDDSECESVVSYQYSEKKVSNKETNHHWKPKSKNHLVHRGMQSRAA